MPPDYRPARTLQKAAVEAPKRRALLAILPPSTSEYPNNSSGHGVGSVMPSESTMVILSPQQRRILAETVRDIANIAAGAMVFGQFVAGGTFLPRVAAAGAVVWIVLVVCSIVVAKGSQ